MKKFSIYIFGICALAFAACDLQPKILALPDTVGEFISARYPALLADPETQPEIYNAASIDYGVYASPNLYGSVDDADYVEYASVNDYIVPPSATSMYGDTPRDIDAGAPIVTADAGDADYLRVPMYGGVTMVQSVAEITVAPGDTLYSLAQMYGTTVDALARENNLSVPYALSVGQKLKVPVEKESGAVQTVAVPADANTTTRVELSEITVAAGDTLYSLSRRYSVPVNDLAVMNNLSAPFALSVGQKLKVPDLSSAPVRSVATTKVDSATVPVAKPKEKISSDPTQKLPTIGARSSSKFSWPVRGRVLSAYGAKGDGLFNDGINIAAARGTTVGAAENGVVAYAGNEVKGMGNLIIIQHSGGWMTVYAHLDSMTVRRGNKVSVGQKIGTVGETGKVDEPQLHFEIRKGTKAYNPSTYLK
jgi:murein DD-endopeptidase MepM/ murein hydrolase activator NlpD